MIKIAICDDEAWCREALREYCQNYFEKNGFEYLLMEYGSGEELCASMESVENGEEYFADVLLLDIEMPGISGIQLKDFLQKERRNVRILFITSHEEAMPEAFGSRVFGFLKKPVEYEGFRGKMDSVMEDIRDDEKYVMIERKFGVRKIYLKQIRYIQGDGKYTQLYLEGEESYVFSERSLGSWNEMLTLDGFYLCHKSYLVNFYHVRSMKEDILLKEGSRIPLSRRFRKECMEQYRKYLWEKARSM